MPPRIAQSAALLANYLWQMQNAIQITFICTHIDVTVYIERENISERV